MRSLDVLLAEQCGVVARRQLLALGFEPHDIRRMVRRRQLARLCWGVYVNHTGAPTWEQRAWGAVLYAWPAVLGGDSAIRAAERVSLDSTAASEITVVVDRSRTVVEQAGLAIVSRKALDQAALWNVSPPRLRYEDAVLDRAIELVADDEVDAVAVLARACGSRRTTAVRILARLEARTRVPRRRWLRAVLHDIADGTHSVLEHGYLRRVERPHGLPSPRRQLRSVSSAARVAYRDADVGSLVVELDGRAYHGSATQRDDDLERDLDVLVEEGRPTVRLGWRQVFRHPCRTATKLATLLQRLGWDGSPVPCGDPECAVARQPKIRVTT